MKVYWLSWFDTDSRPTQNPPPNEHILGFWETGMRDDDFSVVAWILATSEQHAKLQVKEAGWQPSEWRFCKEATLEAPSNRFPMQPWNIKRLNDAKGLIQ